MFFLIPCWFSDKVQVVNERVDIFLFMSNFAIIFFALPIIRCGCSPALELRWGEFKTSPKCPDFSYFQLGMPRFLVSLAYTLGLAPFFYRFCEFLFRDPMESSPGITAVERQGHAEATARLRGLRHCHAGRAAGMIFFGCLWWSWQHALPGLQIQLPDG